MRWLASFTMKGRGQAIMSVTVLALLSLLLAPLSLLSGAAIGLVTLRHGTRDGFQILLGAAVASGVLSYLLFQSLLPATIFILALWLPVWLLSTLLGMTRSLALAVESAMLLALLGVGLVYLFSGDPVKMWSELLREPLQAFIDSGQLQTGEMDFEATLAAVSGWMTGILATGFFMQLAVVVFLARWWQAMLYNPGGFGEEFRELRYHRGLGVAAAVLLLGFMFSQSSLWLTALVLLVMAAYFLVGLAVTHAILKRMDANPAWIIGIYMLLILAMPYMMVVLAMTGLTDNWLNFRKIGPSKTEGE